MSLAKIRLRGETRHPCVAGDTGDRPPSPIISWVLYTLSWAEMGLWRMEAPEVVNITDLEIAMCAGVRG